MTMFADTELLLLDVDGWRGLWITVMSLSSVLLEGRSRGTRSWPWLLNEERDDEPGMWAPARMTAEGIVSVWPSFDGGCGGCVFAVVGGARYRGFCVWETDSEEKVRLTANNAAPIALFCFWNMPGRVVCWLGSTVVSGGITLILLPFLDAEGRTERSGFITLSGGGSREGWCDRISVVSSEYGRCQWPVGIPMRLLSLYTTGISEKRRNGGS